LLSTKVDREFRRSSELTSTPQRVSSKGAIGFAAVLMAVYVVAMLLFMENSTYETWGGLFVAPVLILVTLPMLARQAAREADRSVFWLLVAGLIVKLGGALVFHFVAYDLYHGVADAVGYHQEGVRLSEQFRAGNYDHGLGALTSTSFINFLTGILYTIIGPTKFGGYLVFSWFGFLGLFLFYRAFTIAVPEGRVRTYGRLIFFLPSLAFWPSAIGKDAWMTLALGLVAYGAARVLSGETWRGLLIAGWGLWWAAVVRPHVAGLAGVALAVGYLFRPTRKELRQLAPVAKGLSMIVVVVIAAVMVIRAERFLSDWGVETDRGVSGVQNSITASTAQGGSYFVPSILRSPTQTPNAVLTVLFRPLPMEAHNSRALVASLEGTFMLLFTLMRIHWGLAALRSIRRQPYIALALAYTGMFVVAFSSFANFGLLVRQRVQVLPFFLVLLCIPPIWKRQAVHSRSPHGS
jgi:hypothetical protein